MPFRIKILAAKKNLVGAVFFGLLLNNAVAGIPVADGLNLTQTTVTAIQQVAQVTKQIEQYKTQLKQYQNMLTNTVAPAAYVWSEVNDTINKVVSAQQTLDYYKKQLGSIDQYLSRYESVNYYRNSPCFQSNGCSDGDRESLNTRRAESSDAIKRANADVVRTVDQQQQTLRVDAQNLQRLQAQATTATGQMQALGAANQLASAQTNQLLQIRGMLLAQNQAAATLAQQQSDRQAQEEAASIQLRDKSNISRPSPSSWSFK
ncbi:P-type conjugative transfer protein TrbJ [Pseudomonas helleri]|uniref:P-type conjugative transfer protein TrbJ n=1 Tax=Pseudomonas helleri TaxID=1608996 RepID=UPI003FD32ED8